MFGQSTVVRTRVPVAADSDPESMVADAPLEAELAAATPMAAAPHPQAPPRHTVCEETSDPPDAWMVTFDMRAVADLSRCATPVPAATATDAVLLPEPARTSHLLSTVALRNQMNASVRIPSPVPSQFDVEATPSATVAAVLELIGADTTRIVLSETTAWNPVKETGAKRAATPIATSSHGPDMRIWLDDMVTAMSATSNCCGAMTYRLTPASVAVAIVLWDSEKCTPRSARRGLDKVPTSPAASVIVEYATAMVTFSMRWFLPAGTMTEATGPVGADHVTRSKEMVMSRTVTPVSASAPAGTKMKKLPPTARVFDSRAAKGRVRGARVKFTSTPIHGPHESNRTASTVGDTTTTVEGAVGQAVMVSAAACRMKKAATHAASKMKHFQQDWSCERHMARVTNAYAG